MNVSDFFALSLRSWFCAVALIAATHAQAGLITYSDRATFLADVGPTSVTTEGFDAFPTGAIASGASVGDLQFDYNFGGVQLTISSGFDTTTAPNYLGTDDGGILQDGDNFTISFAPSRAIGLSIISLDGLLNGDFTLTVNGTVASLLAGAVQTTLGDGSNVWFLGIASDDGASFTSATLETHGGGGAFLYNVDDISTAAVPEPGSFMLAGFAGLVFARRRLRRRAR